MVQILRNKIDIEHQLILVSDSEEAISSDMESELDEDYIAMNDNSNENRSQDNFFHDTISLKFWWCPSFHWHYLCIEDMRGTPSE